MTAGKARRRNRSQPVRPKLVAAASRSWGIVVRDSYTPNAMFHAMLGKIRNTTANSMPIGFPWNVATKKSKAAGKKTKIGIDWRTSRRGSMTMEAFLFVAAVCPKTIAKTRESKYATTIRAVDRVERGRGIQERGRHAGGDQDACDEPKPPPGASHRGPQRMGRIYGLSRDLRRPPGAGRESLSARAGGSRLGRTRWTVAHP